MLTLATHLLTPVTQLLTPVTHLLTPVTHMLTPVTHMLTPATHLLKPATHFFSTVFHIGSPILLVETVEYLCCRYIAADILCVADNSLVYNPTGQCNEVFQWMPKEHMCILVYLVSVYHALQAGQLAKAQTYSEKALAQIHSLKS